MQLNDSRLRWAEATLATASRLALRYFQRSLKVERKPDASPVTIADRAVETLLRKELARAFPHEPIVGEEFGAPSSLGDSYWTVDPIDGTRAFTRGLPFWGVLLGRVERGQPVLGACLYPALGTFLGVGDRTPAYERTGRRRVRLPRVARPPGLGNAMLLHGGRRWWLSTRYAGAFDRLVRACFLERAYGDCYGYLWLLRGKADAVIEYGVKPWDMVPFAALAQATGRIMTDFSGRPCFTGPETLTAHPRLVRAIARILQTTS